MSEMTPELRRQLARAQRAAERWRQMRSSGYVVFASDGATYLQHKSGARRRVVRGPDDSVNIVKKLSKAQHKAQKKRRHQHQTPKTRK